MRDALERLKQLGCELRPSASDETIASAEAAIGRAFPAEVKDLYRHHDGVERDNPFSPWRLMPLDEVIELYVELPKQWPDPEEAFAWRPIGVVAFWSDDNSNYSGVFTRGPLAGCVCYIDHEELDLSPRHRLVVSFLGAIADAAERGEEWYDMPSDWPSDAHVEDDRATSAALRAEMNDETDDWRRMQLALEYMTVLPLADTEQLVAYLDDRDMWVQERAAKELGSRGYVAATAELAHLAEHGKGNGQHAAIAALGQLNTPQSLAELVRLTTILPKGCAALLGGALRKCGCEAEFDKQCRWRYRLPGSSEWVALR